MPYPTRLWTGVVDVPGTPRLVGGDPLLAPAELPAVVAPTARGRRGEAVPLRRSRPAATPRDIGRLPVRVRRVD
ncbi:hypothetical protein [Rhizohabitans arisaemae]|uniref:hypothetical protein n=1 Tax=Rhizohabitans arisaemae TaxID=2720610 RepID=UPI0024B0C403|nr:hypothetical protein [Rhizohabitans arisaemae]